MSGNLKVAIIDIETAPNVGYTWAKWETNVIEFTKEWYILSFAVKWADSKKVEVYTLPDFPIAYRVDPTNDYPLMKKLWEVLDQADIVVGHNSDKFDLKKANTRFVQHGMTPPSPYKTVDTLKLARRYLALNSNKLNDIAKFLGIGQKAETGGFQLWLDCMAGKPKAWAKMKKYNAQDVVLTEKVHNLLRSWNVSQPNINPNSPIPICPGCGSRKVQRRGYTYLVAFRTQRFVCLACGKWSKGSNEKIPGRHLR